MSEIKPVEKTIPHQLDGIRFTLSAHNQHLANLNGHCENIEVQANELLQDLKDHDEGMKDMRLELGENTRAQGQLGARLAERMSTLDAGMAERLRDFQDRIETRFAIVLEKIDTFDTGIAERLCDLDTCIAHRLENFAVDTDAKLDAQNKLLERIAEALGVSAP